MQDQNAGPDFCFVADAATSERLLLRTLADLKQQRVTAASRPPRAVWVVKPVLCFIHGNLR